MRSISVTGTWGKTTTAHHIANALLPYGSVLLSATWGFWANGSRLDIVRSSTTSTRMNLDSFGVVPEEYDFYVFEAAAGCALKDEDIGGILKADISILTATGPSTHEHQFGGRYNYLMQKANVLDMSDTCVINKNDENIRLWRYYAKKKKVIEYSGYGEESPVEIANIILSELGFPESATSVEIPGRYEFYSPCIIIDKCDQPGSYEALAKRIARNFPGQPVTVVIGMNMGKLDQKEVDLRLRFVLKLFNTVFVYEQWTKKGFSANGCKVFKNRKEAYREAISTPGIKLLLGNGDQALPDGTDREILDDLHGVERVLSGPSSEIRKPGRKDVRYIYQMLKAYGRELNYTNDWQKEAIHVAQSGAVYCEHGVHFGFSSVCPARVWVHPEKRRQGIGSRLMQYLGCRSGSTSKTNEPSKAMLQKLGYAIVSENESRIEWRGP